MTDPLTLDPTPARGFAQDVSLAAPTRFVREVAGAVAVSAGAVRYYNDTDHTIKIRKVHLSVGTAPTGAALIVDVNKNGVTIFTNQALRPTIAINGFTGTATLIEPVELAPGEYVTIDVDQIGSAVAGSNLRAVVQAG